MNNDVAVALVVIVLLAMGWAAVDFWNETPCQGCGKRLGAARYRTGVWCERCREEIELEDRS
jgi:hypothetical protein